MEMGMMGAEEHPVEIEEPPRENTVLPKMDI